MFVYEDARGDFKFCWSTEVSPVMKVLAPLCLSACSPHASPAEVPLLASLAWSVLGLSPCLAHCVLLFAKVVNAMFFFFFFNTSFLI